MCYFVGVFSIRQNGEFMTESKSSNKTLFKYLGFTFGIAYAVQISVWIISKSEGAGNNLVLSNIAKLILAAMMFVPLLGVIISGAGIKDIGWQPKFKGNILILLFGWFMPAIVTAIGAAIYFLVFPTHLDMAGEYLREIGQGAALDQMEAMGITYRQQLVISTISSLTYAPIINMVVAVGEEAGWRGYMYPVLKEKSSRTKSYIIGGIIWGMWHWPLIMLTGYEYGTGYKGFPIVGMFVFCIFTVALGILCDYTYEKTNCIWYPALLHGNINAAATIPIVMAAPSVIAPTRLLGPSPNGLLAGIPLFAVAILIYFRMKKRDDK